VNAEPFREQSEADLDLFLRGTAPELRERAAAISSEIRSELGGDLTAVRPRPALTYLLQMRRDHVRYAEVAAQRQFAVPDLIWNFHAEQLSELVGWIERLEPVSGRRFFEPEPVTAFTVAGWTVTYAPWDAEDLDWPDADPPFEQRFLELLAENPSLWQQQRLLLSKRLYSAMTLAGLENGEELKLTPEQLLEFRGQEMENGAYHWRGINGLPFTLGRITALLGAPPETHGPGGLLAVSRGSSDRHFIGVDDALSLFSNQPQTRAAAGEALTSALLSSTAVADVERIGSDRIADQFDSFRLGVRRGQLFCETIPNEECPPWFRSK